MARIRSVHPGFFTDEDLVAVSAYARLFYLGLLTECDDGGVFEWKPTGLKIRILPNDAVDPSRLLEELAVAGRVMKYEMSGRQFGAVRNFCRYQRPKSPKFTHPNTEESRNWVGLAPASGEPDADEEPPVPPKEEKSPQMEEVGGGGKPTPSGRAQAPPVNSDQPAVQTDKGELFAFGKKLLGRTSGGQVTKLLAAKDGNVVLARAVLERASTSGDPAAYIAKAITHSASGAWDGSFN